MRAFLLLLITACLIGIFALGNHYGTVNTDRAWVTKIATSTALLEKGAYRIAAANVKACVVSVDSSLLRFLGDPTPEGIDALKTQYGACDVYWDLLSRSSPENSEEYRSIDEARWIFNNWEMQIDHTIQLQVRIILAANEGKDVQVMNLYKALVVERGRSKLFKDQILRELFKSW